MSPLRHLDEDHDELDYDIARKGEVRVAYSYGSALYAVRGDLTSLDEWCDLGHQVGKQFMGIFGQTRNSLCRESSNRAAATKLRTSLIEHLDSADFEDKAENDLRDSLLHSLRAQEKSPVYDPFKVVFTLVAQSARRLYGTDWPGTVKCSCRAIGEEPLPGSDFWVNAYTKLPVDDLVAPPSVSLLVHPDQLNIKTYSTIYAIFVHECFCHVPAHRVKQDNESVFSEGFCDWAAHKLFDRWASEIDPSLEDAARKFGEELWERTKSRQGGNQFWRPRSIGHRAASHVVRMFRDDGATPHEADDLVINLARQLVVADAGLERKDNFVRELGALRANAGLRARLDMWRNNLADVYCLL